MIQLTDLDPVTIPINTTTSDPIECGAKVPICIVMPAAFTGTAVTIQSSFDGSSYQTVYVGGSDYTVSVAASKNVPLIGLYLAHARFIKIVSNATETTARAFSIITRRGDK